MTAMHRMIRTVAILVSIAGLCASCADDPRGEAAANTWVRDAAPGRADSSRAPAAVDTLRDHLVIAARRVIQPRADTAKNVVILFIREQDVFTCEDLGRQSRELRDWASNAGLPFIVWATMEQDTRLLVFFRREHIPASDVILTSAPLELEKARVPRSPAAMVVDSRSGEALGIVHPERVANVRQRSFAQELKDLYRSNL